MDRSVRERADLRGIESHHRGIAAPVGMEELPMRTIFFVGMQFAFWSAFYTLLTIFKDERMILASFAGTLVISMVTAAVFLVKPRE